MRGIHHIGVAVTDLDEAIASYEQLFGAEFQGRQSQDDLGVEAASMRLGPAYVELLAALGPETTVGRFIDRRGPGMHHIAYEVDDLAGELERLEGEGVDLIDHAPRPGLFGMQVAFVYPQSVYGVLTELVARG